MQKTFIKKEQVGVYKIDTLLAVKCEIIPAFSIAIQK